MLEKPNYAVTNIKTKETYRFSADKMGGFTLIELSISLVIIGLIVGGILGAQELIRQAELRSVVSDVQAYRTAFNVFKLKYDALPGDMRTATDYWSGSANGNGDGVVTWVEGLRAWEQLALSGIVPGSYPGVLSSGNIIPGIHAPAGSIDNSLYVIRIVSSYSTRTDNALEFGGPHTGGLPIANQNILTTPDAKSLDDKIDDGVANSGNTWALGTTCTGFVWNVAPGGDYDLDAAGDICAMIFYLEKR